MPRRFVWAAAALVGVGSFQLDWTSGATRILPFQLMLLGAGFLRANEAAPWIMMFGFPMGALWALSRYRRWRRDARGMADGAPEAMAPHAT